MAREGDIDGQAAGAGFASGVTTAVTSLRFDSLVRERRPER
jgi:hypothetical protein